MRMEMGGIWEAVACSCCSLAVGGSGNEEDNGEMASMTNGAPEMQQQHDMTIKLPAKDKWCQLMTGD